MASGAYNNPFEEQPSAPPLPPHPVPELPPIPQRPYDYQGGPSMDQLQERERTLQIKEQELAEWERRLAEREGTVAPPPQKPRPNNWPPFKPFLHHNIDGDMPTPEAKATVRKAYLGWLAFLIVLIWNLVAVTAVLAVGGSGAAADFVLGLVYLFLLPPLTFLIYRMLYQGARKGKASLYLVYLCFLILDIIVFIVLGLGIPGSGGGGFIHAINAFDANAVVGIILLVAGALWMVLAIYHIVVWFFVRRAYRNGTGGFNQAKKEATTTAMHNMA